MDHANDLSRMDIGHSSQEEHHEVTSRDALARIPY